MYKKFLIIASKEDKAGMNIISHLPPRKDFEIYLIDKGIIYDENINKEKINSYDFVIFVSKHVSESNDKTLSIHAPGNWRFADYGGERGKVCRTSALFIKQLFENINKNVEEQQLKEYKVTLEVTHHGPLIDKPCVFVEIGSTENEWTNKRAGFIIAKTILETIEKFEINPNNEIAIAIGGPHYCPNFNEIQLKSNVAISHIIPQYVFPLTEEMVSEALQKTEEEVDTILLSWNGLGKAERRKEIMDILDKFPLQKRKTSEICKE